jgi:hypothetical protein
MITRLESLLGLLLLNPATREERICQKIKNKNPLPE